MRTVNNNPFPDPKALGHGRQLLAGSLNIAGGVGWTWVAMLYPLGRGSWLCGLAQAAGEPTGFHGPAPARISSGTELLNYLVAHWEQHTQEVLHPHEMEGITRDLRNVDRSLSDEFSRALSARPVPKPVMVVSPPKRIRRRHSADTIEGIEERLRDVERWTRGPKAALQLLHRTARAEQLQRQASLGTPGPYELLEVSLFGDPNQLMSNDDEQGRGFSASLMDGPLVDIFSLAGIDPSDELHDAVWGDHNWQSILDQCDEAFCVEVGEQDEQPGMSDIFYWVCVTNPAELARQLREFIVSKA
ncbi:MAG: hypothetical protein NTV97_31365 [Alphaproteobacteria bacterium]|nr:hypothetical protein [Alphaproteobacteria bacterium]